jgi:hypothetical protein
MSGTKKKRRHPLGRRRKLRRTESGVVAGPKYNRRGGNPDALAQMRQNEIFRSLPKAIKIDDLAEEAEYFRPKPRSFFTCQHCSKEVDCQPYQVGMRAFCSVDCRYAHTREHGTHRPDGTRWTTKARKRYKKYVVPLPYRMSRWLRELRDPNLTPAQAARLRGQIASGMDLMIQEAEDVVFGKKAWTPTQARVFGLLMGKVLPDLSASHIVSEKRDARPEEMSIEELEELLSATRQLAAPDPNLPANLCVIESEHHHENND